MRTEIAIVGSGFAGAVIARELARSGRYRITVFEERGHIAGNCHTEREPDSGVMVHKYGPHIFHTDREDVWNYIRQFGTFGPYTNRVKALTARGVFSLPINLLTINQFFGKRFDPRQAAEFVQGLGDKTIETPLNFEEQALSMVGRELYENFFYGYTKKQWGIEPRMLPASILKRLPLRFSYDDNYYNSRFQGIPTEGYTSIVAKMLDHPDIHIELNQSFTADLSDFFAHTFYSGPIDAYFSHRCGKLNYRTLDFVRSDATGDHQGNPVLNYCEASVPHTRTTEHKHFAPWERHSGSVIYTEFSRAMEKGDIPYYPMRLTPDKILLGKYVALAHRTPKVSFVGRLGTYRYLDMHMVIGECLDFVRQCLRLQQHQWPKFSGEPLPGVMPVAYPVDRAAISAEMALVSRPATARGQLETTQTAG